LWDHNPDEARGVITRLLATAREELRTSVAQSYSRILGAGLYNDADIAVLRALLTDPSAWVTRNALPAEKVGLVIELARAANVGDSHDLANELLTVFTFHQLFQYLAVEDVKIILEKLIAIAELDGHRIEEFLAQASQAFPQETMDFFMRRVERAGESEDWHYRRSTTGLTATYRSAFATPMLIRSC
jgi:hypothetical protein